MNFVKSICHCLFFAHRPWWGGGQNPTPPSLPDTVGLVKKILKENVLRILYQSTGNKDK